MYKEKSCKKCFSMFTPKTGFAKYCNKCTEYVSRKCKTCDKDLPYAHKSCYCDSNCRDKHVRFDCVCLTCNENFKSFKNEKYCSRDCYYKSTTIGGKGKSRNRKLFSERIGLSRVCCDFCQKEFYKRKCNFRGKETNFCSNNCKFNFDTCTKRISVKCDICDNWFETPTRKLQNKKKTCGRKCSMEYIFLNNKSYVSKAEKMFYRDFLFESKKFKRQVYLLNKYVVDFINYENKLIIEYFGDYWHTNPNYFESEYLHKQKNMLAKDIWDSDNTRIKDLEQAGYTVLVLWENDVKNNPDKIRQILKENKVNELIF